MKIEDLTLFHQVVDAGSVIRGSEIFDIPKSNISRRIKALEEELNILLFHRQNRSIQLTDAGAIFYDKTKEIVNELETTIQDISLPDHEISAHLRIQLFPLPELLEIGRMIFRFMDLYPKISIEIYESSEEQNLTKNHIDVALRLGKKLKDPNLIGRSFLHASFGFYCSKRYIEENGLPLTAEDLERLNMIRFRFPDGKVRSQLPFGKNKTIEVSGNLIVNSIPLAMKACLENRGIIFISDQVAQFYVKEGMFVKLFPNLEPSLNNCWLVYSSQKPISLAANTFIEYMLSEVKNNIKCIASKDDLLSLVSERGL